MIERIRLSAGTLPFPSPRPSPQRRGSKARRLIVNQARAVHRAVLWSKSGVEGKSVLIQPRTTMNSLSAGERAGVRGKGRCDGLARPSLHRELASDLWCFSPTFNHTLGFHAE